MVSGRCKVHDFRNTHTSCHPLIAVLEVIIVESSQKLKSFRLFLNLALSENSTVTVVMPSSATQVCQQHGPSSVRQK